MNRVGFPQPTDTPSAETKTSGLRLSRLLPLGVLAAGIAAFFALGLDQYVSFEALREHRDVLVDFVAYNPLLAPLAFMVIYAFVVAFSLPGGAIMTISGGFLFGTVLGTAFVVLSATAGATILFVIAKTSLGDPLGARAGPWLKKMENGFKENALSYLLVLRLIPLFPFFVVNLVPAFLGVSLRTYVMGTLFGIMPGSFVYATVGAGLGSIFDKNEAFTASGILTPEIVTALVGLSVLSLLPTPIRRSRRAAYSTIYYPREGKGRTMLKGKAAAVTGSTSGIGLGIARALGRAGCDVMMNGLGDAREIEELRGGLADEAGVRVEFSGADMTDSGAIAGMIEAAGEVFGRLDILVNNAGIQHVAPLDEFPADKWDAILAVNLSAAFHASKAALPLMRAERWGRIINIASSHGLVASPYKSAYVAAKHGLVGLTKVIALECAEEGITCNAICPGYVLTPLVEKQIDEQVASHGIPRENVIRDIMLAAQPNKEFVGIGHVAELAVFLCGDAASGLTGTALSVDGGWTAH